jgi:hypothetical protein
MYSDVFVSFCNSLLFLYLLNEDVFGLAILYACVL